MEFLSVAYTDIGIRKETNQDSFCLKVADTSRGKVLFAAVCDGMGGLEKGELASATVVNAFSDWFDNELPSALKDFSLDQIKYRWERIINEQNYKIMQYGKEHNINLGTTLTAVLMTEEGIMLLAHVGDSRAYRISSHNVEMLTEDHTVVGLEVKRGKLTQQEAKEDPRRNVLLQCIGASKRVIPDFDCRSFQKNEVYMLCTDGFRHQVTEEELFQKLNPTVLLDEQIMSKNARELIELNKKRMEMDNITVLLIKIIE